jgi:L-iditol 2-dehydrogenase
MRAIVFLGPQQLELRDVPMPVPGPGEVVVRIEAATTCGTDLKAYKRGHKLMPPPMLFGHEWAGIISAVGAGVMRWREGDRVTAANSAPCNRCFYCRRGQQQLCEDLDNRFNWGTYAEYLRVPAHIAAQNMHIVPAHLAFAHAAIVEPLACAVHCVARSGIQLGDTVAIIGPGAQGLMQIQIAESMGAACVIVIGRSKRRLEIAKQLGADQTFSANDGDAVAFVREQTGGRGADVTIEAAGSADTWQQAFAMTRPGGTAMMFSGLPSGTQVSFDATRLHYSEVTPRATFHHTPRYVEMAMSMLTSGQIDASKLIDGEVPLEQTEEALLRMDRSEVIKLAVVP